MDGTRGKLEAHRNLLHDIRHAVKKIEQMTEDSTAIGSFDIKADKVSSSRSAGARFENMIVDKADLQQIVKAETKKLEVIRSECEQLISKAGTSKGRIVLTLYYLDGLSNRQIADAFCYSDIRYVQRIKSRAISQIDRSQAIDEL